MSTLCCVPQCNERVGNYFPWSQKDLLKKWIIPEKPVETWYSVVLEDIRIGLCNSGTNVYGLMRVCYSFSVGESGLLCEVGCTAQNKAKKGFSGGMFGWGVAHIYIYIYIYIYGVRVCWVWWGYNREFIFISTHIKSCSFSIYSQILFVYLLSIFFLIISI